MTLTDTRSTDDIHCKDRDTESATVARILLSVAVFIAGWATSVALWGIPGLYLPALALVPVVWVLLLIISRG